MANNFGRRIGAFLLAVLAVLVVEPASTLATERLPAIGEASSTAATTGTTSRRVVVVLFNFTNDSSEPWTRSAVDAAVFGETASVADYYRTVSYGALTLWGDVTDWVTVPYDNTNCNYTTWSGAAQTAAQVDVNQYDNVVYIFPRTDCPWAGRSTIGGKTTWINGFMTLHTIGHELGHDLGVAHASTTNCTASGVRVTLSTTCSAVEYGDMFSIMGTGTREMTSLERAQIGWLSDIRTITAAGDYTIKPTETTSPPPLFRVARADGTYLYFEYRQPSGAWDNFSTTDAAVKGVSIRLAPDVPTKVQSKLLDMTPATASFADAALAVGRTFTDPSSGLTVTTVSTSSTGATIRVRWPGDTTPAATPTPTPTPAATPAPTPTPTPAAPTTSPTPSPSATPPTITSSLSRPTDLKATRLRKRKVRVTWGASTGPVAAYVVYRNGNRIGKTTEFRLIDYVPRGVSQANYVVRAIDPKGKLGPRAKVSITLG